MNIFIVGTLTSAYRTETYLRAFLELGYNKIYINSFRGNKILRFLADSIMVFMSDVIFVPPLQHNNRIIDLAVFLKKKIIVDFYISYYDSNVYDYKNLDSNSRKAKNLLKIDQRILQKSELSFFLNESERDLYLRRINIQKKQIKSGIIPLVVPEKKDVAKLNFFRNTTDTMNICWVGTYIPLHGLNVILGAIKILKDSGKKAHLYLWGNSDKAAQGFIDSVAELHITDYVSFINDKWGDMALWEDFIIEKCDVSLGVFGESEKAKTVLPNKVVDGIAFKTPVVTQKSKGVHEFLSYSDDIFACNNTADDLAQTLIELYDMDYQDIQKKINSAYMKYERYFSYNAFYKNVKKQLDSIVGK